MNNPATLPFVLKSTESRAGTIFRLLGETIVVKVSGADTAGFFAVVIETTPPQSGPPLHQHSREDEWFYVLEGEYRFSVGKDLIIVREGDSLFAPRNIPHTFQNVASKPGRLLAVNQPAGLEAFFAELEGACASGVPTPAILTPIFEKYGLQLLGPPLPKE
jgi:quercetin dioxygenase-like cupin family protein